MNERVNASEVIGDDSLWYKDAVIYEVHVRAFQDSDGDGIGDFRGLTSRLDYLQDLGVTALWLLPFYPSPLRDDGYDIADYMDVHPSYGTLQDFRTFLHEAHRRGLRVITELVINHTSDQHPWFQRARLAPKGSSTRDFYVWNDTPDKYTGARIIFKDFERSNWTLDPVAGQYYWHRFYHHQPDLNFENPAVHRAIYQVLDFWMGMGVDGMRLDAVPYLFESEDSDCENLPRTHEFLKDLRAYVDSKYPNRMLLAEANQWPEDAAAYFGDGDGCNMNFHFPVMPRLFMSLRMEDRFPIIDIMRQTPAIPPNCQWAMFLRNHDELTLEMVTDEERDYMYRVYAADPQARINLGIRRRLAPLLGNNIRQIELMNALLFSLPGTPIIYYGDEIGMGDNVYLGDRNGVRTPMQWSADRNAGFSKANPQKLYSPIIIDPAFHYEAVNVEAQESNPQLLLWWMKRLINTRKQHKVFGRGTLEFLYPANTKVLAFLRRHEDEIVLIVANLSRFAQVVQLDLGDFSGSIPVELFGQTEFPPIVKDQYYTVTLGAYGFFWFDLVAQKAQTPERADGAAPKDFGVPLLHIRERWQTMCEPRSHVMLSTVLLGYVRSRRWFAAKARHVQFTDIEDVIPARIGNIDAFFTFLRLEYLEGEPEVYLIPIARATGQEAADMAAQSPGSVIARTRPVESDDVEGVLYDALASPAFCRGLIEFIGRGQEIDTGASVLMGEPTQAFHEIVGNPNDVPQASLGSAEQSNTSVTFGRKLMLKLFRRPGEGMNPDVEIGRHLTEARLFSNIARVAGSLEYRHGLRTMPVSALAVLLEYIENQGDAWAYTQEFLAGFLENALAQPGTVVLPRAAGHILDMDLREMPTELKELAGPYFANAELLGKRTGELHLALARGVADASFAPEPFTELYQRSVYSSMRTQTIQVVQMLRSKLPTFSGAVREQVRHVIEHEDALLHCFDALRFDRFDAIRMRIHGDYHLGQLLFTGRDFMIIDFEGEPGRPVSERRLKRSPLRDIAGMVRSFDYAAQTTLRSQGPAVLRPEDVGKAEPWATEWAKWAATVFVKSYLETVQPAHLLPEDPARLKVLLDDFVLSKALYEVSYELNNRPDWVEVPLRGVLAMIPAPLVK
ncbi:MAG: maltose alpha-D-glucosyltransferase [SAR202 cluster bacterium]|nr:maltose alpha-D-glucosyltransferase [SAR202 cluster bacterium]